MKVDFGDFQFLRIEPKVVRYISGVATASLASGGLYTTKNSVSFTTNVYMKMNNVSSFEDVCKMNLLFPLLTPIITEFSSEEFRTAKVDPIYQFSKPITVWPSGSIICS